MPKSIVIMAGGTGGHVFPALAVAHYFLEQGWNVSWIGTDKGMENRVVAENNIDIDRLSVNGLRGKGGLALLKMPSMLLKTCLQARAIFKQRKPNVVLGMGGFVAGPGGVMAKLMGIPLVIHEQNRIPGTTNRLLSRFATKVLQAFPNSFTAEKKAVFTGNPLRKEFIAQQSVEAAHKKNLQLLVMGGSLGAQRLNELVPEAIAQLQEVEVHHQTGEAMQQQVADAYQQSGIEAETTAFISDVVAAYRRADIVICRAGAMTVSEVAAMGLPSILIPYPYAIDDHQTANAQYLVEAGAAVMINQKELTAIELVTQIKYCIEHKEMMAKAAKQCAKLNATEGVAAQCRLVVR